MTDLICYFLCWFLMVPCFAVLYCGFYIPSCFSYYFTNQPVLLISACMSGPSSGSSWKSLGYTIEVISFLLCFIFCYGLFPWGQGTIQVGGWFYVMEIIFVIRQLEINILPTCKITDLINWIFKSTLVIIDNYCICGNLSPPHFHTWRPKKLL